MTEATFERVTDSDKALFGAPKVIFCGFPAKAFPALTALMEMAGLGEVPAIYAGAAHRDATLRDLFELPTGSGAGIDSDLPRAIIVGGITEKALQQLMGAARASRMQPPLWAVLTPVSESWTLADLLRELAAEREALQGSAATRS